MVLGSSPDAGAIKRLSHGIWGGEGGERFTCCGLINIFLFNVRIAWTVHKLFLTIDAMIFFRKVFIIYTA